MTNEAERHYKAQTFEKKVHCPKCQKKVNATIMGYVDDKIDFKTQAICKNGHFLKGVVAQIIGEDEKQPNPHVRLPTIMERNDLRLEQRKRADELLSALTPPEGDQTAGEKL